MRDDPRVTPVGPHPAPLLDRRAAAALERAARRDEPRRPAPAAAARLRAARGLAPRALPGAPGDHGLWQVSGRSELGFDDLVRLDFYYVENWSVWLDIEILARTPLAVIRGRGAY